MADVIICLGNVLSNPIAIADMTSRTENAIQLYMQKRAKKILFTGGFKTRKDLSEARFMADIAVRAGVPKRDILLEEKANTTIGNAFYSKRLIEKNRFRSILLVTAPFHMRRAEYIFRQIIPGIALETECCAPVVGFFKSIPYRLNERKELSRLKKCGIDLSKV